MLEYTGAGRATVDGDNGLRAYVEQLLRDEIAHLELPPLARAQLLPPYVQAAIVEIVTNTVMRLEGDARDGSTRDQVWWRLPTL
jgi:hypothetical protein